MAESKNSFIGSKMNKDLDERLIPSNQYRDALNVAVSRSEASDVGALESIPGNFLISNNNPAGVNAVIIGVYVDESNARAFVFKTDYTGFDTAPSSAYCSIDVFTETAGSIQTLVSGSWLNFSTQNRVNAINLIENLLFFTDNKNQPRKINVDIASANNSYYYNEDQISVAKFAPNSPPNFINLRGVVANPFLPEGTVLPSTMSDASDPFTTSMIPFVISTSNLAVKKYRNGDSIVDGNSLTDWNAAGAAGVGAWCYYDNNPGNGEIYGLLYNKYAVMDPRGLAPIGFGIPTQANWSSLAANAAGASSSTNGLNMKSTDLWFTPIGTNAQGFNAKPAGSRKVISSQLVFEKLGTQTTYWNSDPIVAGASNAGLQIEDATTQAVVFPTNLDPTQGYSVRVIKEPAYTGWNGDPDFLTEKFARFSYRFKFDDNEYSVVAPWSQDVFIPKQDGYFLNNDQNDAFVTTVVRFMENSINNAVLNIELPSIDIINDYKITDIDVLFKASDSSNYQILETIKVNADFISSLNYTNIFQYSYQSKEPVKTLPSFESTRTFDKVPVRALAQETAGNRVIYGNYIEGNSAPNGLFYYIGTDQKSEQDFEEYPQHSLKQNRNYQIGFVLADKYGRQTDIVLSNYDGLLDNNGNPQPGSNIFSTYKPLSFSSASSNGLTDWRGDNATINYLQQIPEEIESNGISGYPGAYAQGNYFDVNPSGGPGPYFLSESENFFSVEDPSDSSFPGYPTGQSNINFGTKLQYASAIDTNNVLNVYTNQNGNGWALQALGASFDYTITTSGPFLRVVFNNALPVRTNVKVEILYGPNKRHKYQAGGSFTQTPLFPNFANTYTSYFAVGKKWTGEYIDYTETTSVTPVDAGHTEPYGVIFETKEQISIKYLFNATPAAQNPPSLSAVRTFASYDINPLGFYTYRVGIKQQEQDYYNAYLPGFINGYPIFTSGVGAGGQPIPSEVEINEIYFSTLVADNINKIPRNLQDVGPIQNQFTSDAAVFPRVENQAAFFTTFSGNSEYELITNKQFLPASTADRADLVGGIDDAFPGIEPEIITNPPTTGQVPPFLNNNSIYNYDQKPQVVKFTSSEPIGLTTDLYTAPEAAGSATRGNYPYSPNLSLSIVETSPFVSNLELFYETSTGGLISDINNDIANDNDIITNVTPVNVNFPESTVVGTTITSPFFPQENGVSLTNTTGEFVTIFNHDPQGNLDTSVNYADTFNPSFTLVNGGVGGYTIQTAKTFYAGQPAGANPTPLEPDTCADQRGRYLARIAFTMANNTVVERNVTLQLTNSDPVISDPNFIPERNILDYSDGKTICSHSTTAPETLISPGGANGSAKLGSPGGSPPTSTGNDQVMFATGVSPETQNTGYGWSVDRVVKTNGLGEVTIWDSSWVVGSTQYAGLPQDIVNITFQAPRVNSGGVFKQRFTLQMINSEGIDTTQSSTVGGAGQYNATMVLKDTGSQTEQVVINWIVGQQDFTDLRYRFFDKDTNGDDLGTSIELFGSGGNDGEFNNPNEATDPNSTSWGMNPGFDTGVGKVRTTYFQILNYTRPQQGNPPITGKYYIYARLLMPNNLTNSPSAQVVVPPNTPPNNTATADVGFIKPDGTQPYGFQSWSVTSQQSQPTGSYSFSSWAIIGEVDGFDPTNNQQAVDVTPGQQNPTPPTATGTYDYNNGALLNCVFQYSNSGNAPNQTRFQIFKSTQQINPLNIPGSTVPSYFSSLGTSSVDINFYGNGNNDVFPGVGYQPGSQGLGAQQDRYPLATGYNNPGGANRNFLKGP